MAFDTEQSTGTALDTLLATEAFNLLGHPMIIADGGLVIRYLNQAAMDVFHAIEPEVQKDMPHFKASEIVGQSIDVFHKNPSHQQRILSGMTGHHNGKISLGGRSLDFRISRGGGHGASALYLVELNDVTDQQRERRQLDALVRRVGDMADRHLDGFINDFIEFADLDPSYAQVGERVNLMVQDHIATKKKIITCMNAFSKGDFDFPFEPLSGDRVFINEAIADIRSSFSRVVNDIRDLSAAIVRGDLKKPVDAGKYDGAYREIMESFAQAIDGLNSRFGDIKRQTQVTERGSNTVSHAAQALASLALQQSAAIDQISASVEENDALTKANSNSAQTMSAFASETKTISLDGQTKVGTMQNAMERIFAASQDISKIIKVIDEIAFQTNLLALNAAVEAARAGEHGRGFAVVAQEVRSLAGRSASAASETSNLIETSSQIIKEGVTSANETKLAFDKIAEKIVSLEEAAGEIAQSSAQQSIGMNQIANAVNELSKTGQDASSQSEQLANTAQEMNSSARAVSQILEALELRSDVAPTQEMLTVGGHQLTQAQLQQIMGKVRLN